MLDFLKVFLLDDAESFPEWQVRRQYSSEVQYKALQAERVSEFLRDHLVIFAFSNLSLGSFKSSLIRRPCSLAVGSPERLGLLSHHHFHCPRIACSGPALRWIKRSEVCVVGVAVQELLR